ncbi:MAG: DinB family protein [Bacteroidota bacterium]|jgi:uncharacterized damage-inducible protein DinB|nr:DinB family protein [Bacteroidota bacterium]
MKQLFIQYAAYNLWANKILLDKLAIIPPEILFKETGSSFGTIYKTIVHLMNVESIWWQRMKLQEHVQLPGNETDTDFSEFSKKWLSISKEWSDWANEASENKMTFVFSYQNTRKEYFKQPVYEVLLHLFNHQTFHRGQIITLLRQNGIDKIPATDFIVFSRTKAFKGLKGK